MQCEGILFQPALLYGSGQIPGVIADTSADIVAFGGISQTCFQLPPAFQTYCIVQVRRIDRPVVQDGSAS